MTDVPHGTLCCNCDKEPRKPGQRWCLGCHKAYMRQWRKDQKAIREDLVEEVARLRAENAELKQLLQATGQDV
jgi:hypothetical protein